jgi:hypothetical protein
VLSRPTDVLDAPQLGCLALALPSLVVLALLRHSATVHGAQSAGGLRRLGADWGGVTSPVCNTTPQLVAVAVGPNGLHLQSLLLWPSGLMGATVLTVWDGPGVPLMPVGRLGPLFQLLSLVI